MAFNGTRRVVITGMGAITPIGNTVEEFWNNLLAGVSGAAPITYFDASEYDTKFACQLKGFDPLKFMDRKLVQRCDPFTHYALAAAEMAVADSGVKFESVDRDRVGVIWGSGIGGMQTNAKQQQTLWESKGPHRISPFFIPMMISDIAAGRISMKYGVKGPNYATTSACATSSHAIGDSFILIQRGDADIMITGGSEAGICEMGIGGFNAMKALSTRNDAPTKASRPFDKERDGFVMGEGGGAFILEELGHAMKRGAKIYAEVSGIGFTADAHHITEPAPEGEGAQRSMRIALKDAGLPPESVQYINTHGTSTPVGDKNETAAIKKVFGDHAKQLAVNSTKSMIGHLLGAAGAVESIATVLSIVHNKVHPTINQVVPDEECDLNYIPNTARDWKVDVAISNTFGFGGHNASILFRRYIG
ncbi:MAG TPA: beta-ketoacyl-[acyl-carrier-protein] synthase II [Bacteroidetes bacterium]|nr:MAG: beta-ketoacyl-[acyl-carrier-protein] synthase II [Ignavibacteria bacterium GWC2_56_12]HAV24433.1 beta-ketoacyl-[acyl-carrier-protein] synthase II [Bacteroidota bacterium]